MQKASKLKNVNKIVIQLTKQELITMKKTKQLKNQELFYAYRECS